MFRSVRPAGPADGCAPLAPDSPYRQDACQDLPAGGEQRHARIDLCRVRPGTEASPNVITEFYDVDGSSAPVVTTSPARRRPIPRLLAASLLVGAAVVPLLRQTGVHSWDTIWGEDGWVYFQQAHDHGLSVVMRGYSGYLQLAPRILAIPSVVVPIRQLALYFALASGLVGAALAWFVFWASADWIDSRSVRLALASLVVLMPALGYENTANATNTIWILLAVAPWALLSLSERSRDVLICSVVAFAAATATALAAVLSPLVLLWALVRRRRPTWTVAGAFCAGLALQFAVVVRTRDTRPRTTIRQAGKLPEIIGVKVFGQLLIGERGIRALWDHHFVLTVMVPVVALVGLVLLLAGSGRRNQLLAIALVGLALVCFLVPAWGRGTNQVALALTARTIFGPAQAGRYNPMSTRYVVAPVFLLASAAAISLGSSQPSRRRRPEAWRLGFVAWVIALTVVSFSVWNPRSLGPSWSESVDAAYRAHCAGQAPATRVKVRVPNRSVNPPVVLTCRELTP
jgi:hypothetical protein